MNKTIDPFRLADQAAELTGQVPLAQLPRLHDLLCHQSGDVHYQLQFGKDAEGCRTIHGQIEATLPLICQRCNQELAFALQIEFLLSPIISDKQATSLPASYEPLVTAGEPVTLQVMLEEEILLALPMIPMHDPQQCPQKLGDDSALA